MLGQIFILDGMHGPLLVDRSGILSCEDPDQSDIGGVIDRTELMYGQFEHEAILRRNHSRD